MSQVFEVKVRPLPHFDPSFELPFYATADAAGADVRASFADKQPVTIAPGARVLIPTGLSFEIPPRHEIQVRPRSGLSLKSPLLVVNAPGTIDADYRGEVQIIVGNFSSEPYVVEHGLRIAQLVFAPVWQAKYVLSENLTTTARGSGGFGSTGVN